jgi:hydroxymethylglutaryl-CoA synthase
VSAVGIEKIGVWPGTLALRMSDLCAARGHDLADIRDQMMIDERSLCPLWEDPVTMAVNAAEDMLSEADREAVELLIVASESGVDQEKPLSTWVQRYLRLTPHCRNLEVKHACYGGTAGLQLAAHWIASGLSHGKKALVIGTDMSRMHLGQPWEYVMGASAAAVLVSGEPRLVELEPGRSGYWTSEVSDLTRPTSRVETGNSETSLVSYLEALENAYAHYITRVPEAADYEGYFRRHVYHAPFGGMTWRAHKTLLRRVRAASKADALASFAERTLPSLRHVRRLGGTYSASTFVGLLGLLETSDDLRAGERVSVFSYGSGSCAEFYGVRVAEGAPEAARRAGTGERLDARRTLTVAEYEDLERRRTALVDEGDYEVPLHEADGWFDRAYAGRRRLVFLGMRDFYRQYGWCHD